MTGTFKTAKIRRADVTQNKYKITYEIELEADSPQEAAESVFSWMQDPASYPPILGVRDLATGEETDVDLSDDEDEEPPTCILTGEDGENPDDCTTHEHEEN